MSSASDISLIYRCLALLLALAVATVSPAPAVAAMIETDQVLSESIAGMAETDRERLRGLLTRDDVRAELRNMGLEPDEAAARVDAMSDSELASLAGQIETLPAGREVVGTPRQAFVVFIILVLVVLLL